MESVCSKCKFPLSPRHNSLEALQFLERVPPMSLTDWTEEICIIDDSKNIVKVEKKMSHWGEYTFENGTEFADYYNDEYFVMHTCCAKAQLKPYKEYKDWFST